MATCGPLGELNGAEDDCWPCPPDHDPFKPDPGNPETIEGGETVELCVTGGVPPYYWEKTSGECLSPNTGSGQCIYVYAEDQECCIGGYNVTDACGNEVHVGLRSLDGVWVEIDNFNCPVTGNCTVCDQAIKIIIRGLYRIRERVIQPYAWSAAYGIEEDCPPGTDGAYSRACEKCYSHEDCDPDLGCFAPQACIIQNQHPNCTIGEYCVKHGSDWLSDVTAYCISLREVFEWRCPE